MGRYIILLTAPLIIGALIAAGIIVLSAVRRRSVDNEVRRRRIEARRTMLAAKRQADAPFAADPVVTEQPSHRAQHASRRDISASFTRGAGVGRS